jgi:hypothetical protein
MLRPRHPDREVMTVKNLVWFVLGTAFGFVLAHVVNKDPRGHELLAQVDARVGEFTDRMTDAYHEQEARFSGFVDDARDAAAAAASSVTASAAAVVDATAESAADAIDGARAAVSDADKNTD